MEKKAKKNRHQKNCQKIKDKGFSFNKVQNYGKRTKHFKNRKQRTNRRKNGFFRLLEAPLAPQVGSELKNEQRINRIQSLTVS